MLTPKTLSNSFGKKTNHSESKDMRSSNENSDIIGKKKKQNKNVRGIRSFKRKATRVPREHSSQGRGRRDGRAWKQGTKEMEI